MKLNPLEYLRIRVAITDIAASGAFKLAHHMQYDTDRAVLFAPPLDCAIRGRAVADRNIRNGISPFAEDRPTA